MSSLQRSNNSASGTEVHPSLPTEVAQLELFSVSSQASPSLIPEGDVTARIATLEAELQQYKEKEQARKTKTNKKERVKAVFNVLNNFVKYYNTGETYLSRIFTLVGVSGIIAGSLFGVSQLPPVKNQLSQLTPILQGISPASESPRNTSDSYAPVVDSDRPAPSANSVRPASITNPASSGATRQSPTTPVVTSPSQPSVSPQTAVQRQPSPPTSSLPTALPAPSVQKAIEDVRQAAKVIPAIPQEVEQVKRQVEQIIPSLPSLPVSPPNIPAVESLPDTPDMPDAHEDSEDD